MHYRIFHWSKSSIISDEDYRLFCLEILTWKAGVNKLRTALVEWDTAGAVRLIYIRYCYAGVTRRTPAVCWSQADDQNYNKNGGIGEIYCKSDWPPAVARAPGEEPAGRITIKSAESGKIIVNLTDQSFLQLSGRCCAAARDRIRVCRWEDLPAGWEWVSRRDPTLVLERFLRDTMRDLWYN